MRYGLCAVFASLLLLSLSVPSGSAAVSPPELTIILDRGQMAVRTIAFTNPENKEITLTVEVVGVKDIVMVANPTLTVGPKGSTTITLFVTADREASGLISLTYDGKIEIVPVTVKFTGTATSPGSGRLAVTYDLYVNVGEPMTMIIRDAVTREAVLDAVISIEAPTPMTISSTGGYAKIPIENSGIYTGSIQAEGYRTYYFVFIARGGEATSGAIYVTSSPSPLIAGQTGQISAVDASGAPARGVSLRINGIPYPNPAMVVATGTMMSVEVLSDGKVVSSSVLPVSQGTTQPPTKKEETPYAIYVFIAAIAGLAYLLYRKKKTEKFPEV
jgi:hypothetical protein